MEKINLFVNKLSEILKDHEHTFNLRYNKDNDIKFNLKNTLYASLQLLNNKSIDSTISDLEVDNIVHASKNALVKKRNDPKTYEHFRKINDDILNKIYDPSNSFIQNYKFKLDYKKSRYIETKEPDQKLFINNTDKRFIACDGMQYNVNLNAVDNEYIKISKNKSYGNILISGLFDVINKIPLNYHISQSNELDINKKKFNETNGFLQQIDKLSDNDIVIFDRWYYSNNLHKTLINNNIGYMFRIKNNSKLFRNMNYGKSKIIKINKVYVQLFKYKIKNEQYNILTSITDKISINEIKALYWRRWIIETDNKKFKYNILCNNIRSKKFNSIATDIECIKFMSIVSSILEYIGKSEHSTNTKINSSNCIHLLYKKLLYLLIYDNDYDEIYRIIGIIYKKLVSIVDNRSCPRVRKSPSTKWNEYGNRYGSSKR